MDDQELHRLLQLKSYEVPSKNSVEPFIFEFQRRQRQALLVPSLFQKFQEGLALFFSEFQVPTMAYVTATAMAIFLSVLILHNDTVSKPHPDPIRYSSSYHYSSQFQPSSINMDQTEPVSLQLNNNNRSNPPAASPLSYILQKKPSPKSSPFSF